MLKKRSTARPKGLTHLVKDCIVAILLCRTRGRRKNTSRESRGAHPPVVCQHYQCTTTCHYVQHLSSNVSQFLLNSHGAHVVSTWTFGTQIPPKPPGPKSAKSTGPRSASQSEPWSSQQPVLKRTVRSIHFFASSEAVKPCRTPWVMRRRRDRCGSDRKRTVGGHRFVISAFWG